MEYNYLGKTGIKVSRFGLGGMRLSESTAEAVRLIRYAIDHGVTYQDSAYIYPDSELKIGQALKDGYREKITLATKCPIHRVQKPEDFERFLDEQLVRLGTDHIDIYLMHGMAASVWGKVKGMGCLDFLDKMIGKSKILHAGFSSHTDYKTYIEIIDSYDWELSLVQMNILDEFEQATLKGIEYAAAKGVGIAIMEPLRGGSIVYSAPPEVQGLLDAFPTRRSLQEWCFRWLYDKPEVNVILSGLSSMEHLNDNLRIFSDAKPNVMNAAEKELILKIRTIFENLTAIPCTGCEYCLPCPQNVNIPRVFSTYNQHQLNKPNMSSLIFYHHEMIKRGIAGDCCIECGQCTEKCPQSLDIPDLLKEAHKELSDFTPLDY